MEASSDRLIDQQNVNRKTGERGRAAL